MSTLGSMRLCVSRAWLVTPFIAMLGAHAADAQTDYRNLDAGRPLRVEDALVTPRMSLDVQLPNVRAEQYGNGVTRWRVDAKAAYGIASFSEVELRVPLIYVVPSGGASGSARTFGSAGVAIGATHAFGVETPNVPAIAIAAEVLLPAGALASPNATYSLKVIATKTVSFARVHLNAGGGSWSVRGAGLSDTTCVPRRFPLPGQDPGCGAPAIPDVPCSVAHEGPSVACFAPPASLAAAGAINPLASKGGRWFGAAGMDHSFGLSSTLVGVDVVAERFVGLYSLTDWTAEIGSRHQWSPRLVVDAGISRHLIGVLQSSGVTVGGAYAFSFAR
ncbi:MAG: hypothetical protein ABJE10_20725 [bacterium]